MSGGGWAGVLVLVWVLLALAAGVWTAFLVLRIWRRPRGSSLLTKVLSACVGATAVLGAGGTLLGLIKAFGAVGGESIDPSQKARILAEGISEAMNCTAFGLLFWVPCVIAVLLLLGKPRPPTTPPEG